MSAARVLVRSLRGHDEISGINYSRDGYQTIIFHTRSSQTAMTVEEAAEQIEYSASRTSESDGYRVQLDLDGTEKSETSGGSGSEVTG